MRALIKACATGAVLYFHAESIGPSFTVGLGPVFKGGNPPKTMFCEGADLFSSQLSAA